MLLIGLAGSPALVVAQDNEVCLPVDDEIQVCKHYFEGNSIDLPVRTVLDSFGPACEHLVVDVLQRQGVMLVDLREPQKFNAKQCATMNSVVVDLPDVRSEVDVLVRLSIPESTHAPEVIAVRVYPDNLLEPLRKFATQHSLVVFDQEGELMNFFDRNEIDYLSRFNKTTEVSVALLVNPTDPERLLEGRGFQSAVILKEQVFDLPQVRAVLTDDRRRVYVEMPLMHDLHTSPLAQKALQDIIHLATNPLSTHRG